MTETYDVNDLRVVKMNTSLCGIRPSKIFCILIALYIILPSASIAGQFTVIRVYDGDTIKSKGHDIDIKVRLVGIDAPETSRKKRAPGQPYGNKAKRYLAGLILNKMVDIKGYGLCPYNRVLGIIFLDGKNINLEMVKQGLAEVYRGKHPHDFDIIPYRRAEVEAREAARGMWSQGEEYISPKEWRKRNRRK